MRKLATIVIEVLAEDHEAPPTSAQTATETDKAQRTAWHKGVAAREKRQERELRDVLKDAPEQIRDIFPNCTITVTDNWQPRRRV